MSTPKSNPKSSPTKSPGSYLVAGQMDFFDALREVMNGNNVTKLEWNNPDIYICLHNSQLMIRLEDKLLHPLLVSEGDLRGTDWVVFNGT